MRVPKKLLALMLVVLVGTFALQTTITRQERPVMALQFETISALFQASGVGPSITVPAPAGLVEGELLVAIGAVFGTSLAVITPPAGWSKDDEQGFPAFPTGFVATKKATAADVVAGSFLFSQNLGGNEAWTVGIYRISDALGFDSAKIQIVGGSSTTMAEPFIPLTVTGALGLKAVQASFATAGPTSITDSGTQTRRAIVNVPAGPGVPFAIYYTDDDFPIPFPPSTHSAHLPKGTYNGASGAKTSAHYGVSISPIVPGGTDVAPPQDKSGKIITKAEMLAARSHAIKIGAKVKTKFDPRTRR